MCRNKYRLTHTNKDISYRNYAMPILTDKWTLVHRDTIDLAFPEPISVCIRFDCWIGRCHQQGSDIPLSVDLVACDINPFSYVSHIGVARIWLLWQNFFHYSPCFISVLKLVTSLWNVVLLAINSRQSITSGDKSPLQQVTQYSSKNMSGYNGLHNMGREGSIIMRGISGNGPKVLLNVNWRSKWS